MSESGVGTDRKHLGVDVVEIFGAIGESGNFGGTDPSEVHRVENENNVKCVVEIYGQLVEKQMGFENNYISNTLYFPRY